jgi:hypothetical protein
MAGIIVNQGLQVAGDRVAGINGPPTAYTSMAWDNATGAGNTFLAAHTKLNDRAGATSVTASAMDATFPSRATQVVSYQGTIAAGTYNGTTIGRVSIHNIAAGSVTVSSATLCVGIDQQSIAKTADFALTTLVNITYTSV